MRRFATRSISSSSRSSALRSQGLLSSKSLYNRAVVTPWSRKWFGTEIPEDEGTIPSLESYDQEEPIWESYTADSFAGISAQPVHEETSKILRSAITDEEVFIRPDGMIYAPEILYRRRLNDAFGPGGWALMPRGHIEVTEIESDNDSNIYHREWALFAEGRFISQAGGEGRSSNWSGPMTAIEGAKSQALSRCCKDLGIYSELWDPSFIETWKKEHAQEDWYVNKKTGAKMRFWRKVGQEPMGWPWELNDGSAPPLKETRMSEDVDPEVIPPMLKKYAGKTWSEVAASNEGREYLEWVARQWNTADIRALAAQALEAAGDKKKKK